MSVDSANAAKAPLRPHVPAVLTSRPPGNVPSAVLTLLTPTPAGTFPSWLATVGPVGPQGADCARPVAVAGALMLTR